VSAAGWAGCVALWLAAWASVELIVWRAPRRGWAGRAAAVAVPALFGAAMLMWWEAAVRGFAVPAVVLPAPSAVAARIAGSPGLLAADFAQTMKGLAAGYALGCGGGFLATLAIDRSTFLQRGLLPLGTLASTVPVVGVAPIMVMWFGFDWPSKAAVVAAMTFFPMLVNCSAGLSATTALDRDLMSTWGAPYGATLLKMRLPAALPFAFNGLKICTTLALIGAIVAEFFGTPIVGMGFRINAEVGRMNIDTVWATIAVAALSGTLFYGLVAAVERRMTFWHPSLRGRRD
jgi:NitT/TauT family transport system permease protein